VGPVLGRDEGVDEERECIEREIEEQARLAFLGGTGERVRRLGDDLLLDDEDGLPDSAKAASDKTAMPPPPVPTFQRQPKKKKDFSAALGIKSGGAAVSALPAERPQLTGRSAAPGPAMAPGALVGYGTDSDESDED